MSDLDAILLNMKTRRAVRSFTDESVDDDQLAKMAQSARFASSGGNLHPHRFLIVRDRAQIHRLRMFSPGMLAEPPVLFYILLDREQVANQFAGIEENKIVYTDVGTAAQNAMNAAHAMGLGTCPVTSFSKSGVAGVLGLPAHITPELVLMVGHPKPVARVVDSNAPKPLTTRDITFWERFGENDPT